MGSLLLVGAGLLLIGLLLLWAADRLRRRAGVPKGRIIYADTGAWQECPQPLYAASLNLTGKPDYLIKRLGHVIPVEVKTCRAPTEPYPSHVLQLAAYCRLVEEAYGRRPPYGLIHYPERTFSVRYTPALEARLLETMAQMRKVGRSSQVARNHHDLLRCRHCGFAEYCDQRLA